MAVLGEITLLAGGLHQAEGPIRNYIAERVKSSPLAPVAKKAVAMRQSATLVHRKGWRVSC